MRIPKDPFSLEKMILELDRELFNHIRADITNGSAYKMDDETLDMLLTGLWEMGEEELEQYGVVVGVA
jgi:hypothetical protein|tara:strand:+ start:164 stop:367 length:204 start_codon:yes stop_codon:yes gene_type:complete